MPPMPLALPVPPAVFAIEEDMEDDVPPIPLAIAPDEALALPPAELPTIRLRLPDDVNILPRRDRVATIKFSYSHASGQVRGWTTCMFHKDCVKWRHLNAFVDAASLAAWMYEWMLAGSDLALNASDHVFLVSPLDAAVAHRKANMPFA